MNDLPRQTLIKLVEQYGQKIGEDWRRCESLLNDMLQNTCRREVNILIIAARQQIPSEILSFTQQGQINIALARLTRRLIDDFAMAESAAEWGIESWAIALGKLPSVNKNKSQPVVSISRTGLKSEQKSLPKPAGISETVLPPFEIVPGIVIAKLADLPEICENEVVWDEAVKLFATGKITQRLQDQLAHLQRLGKGSSSQKLMALIQDAIRIQQGIDDLNAISSNAALEEFLQAILKTTSKPLVTPRMKLVSSSKMIIEMEASQNSLNFIEVSNTTRGYLFGEIVSNVPWVSLQYSNFGCRRLSPRRIEIKIKPDADMARHGGSFTGEISIKSDIQIVKILIELKVNVDPRLKISAASLNVVLDKFGCGKADLLISNIGTGELSAKINDLMVPFSKLQSNPSTVICESGQSSFAHLNFKFHDVAQLPNIPQMFVRITSNGGDVSVPLKFEIDGAFIHLSCYSIDFGIYKSGPAPSARIEISNIGNKRFHGQLKFESKEPWIQIDKANITIEPSEVQTVDLTVVNAAVKLKLLPILEWSLQGVLQIYDFDSSIPVHVSMVSKFRGRI